MGIPKSCEIASLTITTEIDRELYNTRGIVGEAVYPHQKIVIDPSVQQIESIEQSYTHELVHWILYVMNEHELRQNEKFIDTFAHLLLQAFKSQKGFIQDSDLGGLIKWPPSS